MKKTYEEGYVAGFSHNTEVIVNLEIELDNANSKVSELSNRILKAIDVLLDTTLDYTDGDFESMRFQNDIVKILKGVDR